MKSLFNKIKNLGGNCYYVGGYVRDSFFGKTSKDIDIEVFNISIDTLKEVLSSFGEIDIQGESFSVIRCKAFPNVDFSLPRTDSKSGEGHKGFEVVSNPFMSTIEACKRRDFTINSLMRDCLSGEIIDHFGGIEDINSRTLRIVDSSTFGDDPLRALRGIQFAARFDLVVEENTKKIMGEMDLSSLPGERLFEEFNKLMLSSKPSVGLNLMKETGIIRFFPEIENLIGVNQHPVHHSEGDVFIHTCMVVDEASKIKSGNREEDLVLMYASLCHDFGKHSTTFQKDGKWVSYQHEEAGEKPTKEFFNRFKSAPISLQNAVVRLVIEHLKPAFYPKQNAGRAAYRKLSRRLFESGTNPEMLLKVAMADQFGRTTEKAINREFSEGEIFIQKMNEYCSTSEIPKDAVMGKDLIQAGMKPGKYFGAFLKKCQEIQDDTGISDVHTLISMAKES